jgi:hypothetical protein
MATVAAPLETPPPATSPRQRTRFYFALSLTCLAVGLLGFAPTYWVQVPMGTFTGTPLMHIHGLLFTGWLLLLVGQNWRIAQGRLDHHRAWGLAGIALASAIFVVGVTTSIVALEERYAQGLAERGREFLIVPLFSIFTFAGFVAAAMANLRRPEWHRRFIFVATTAMLVPAIARVFFIARNGWAYGTRPGLVPPAPLAASFTAILVACLVIVAGMAHDWRQRGKVHQAWTIGLGVFVIGGLLRAPVAASGAWQAFADWTTRLT